MYRINSNMQNSILVVGSMRNLAICPLKWYRNNYSYVCLYIYHWNGYEDFNDLLKFSSPIGCLYRLQFCAFVASYNMFTESMT